MGNPVTSRPGISLCFHDRPGFPAHAGIIPLGRRTESSGKPGVLQLDHPFKPALE
jgi:hypothetical protein